MWRGFELYLLVATERDALHLRTNVRKHKVHMYRVQSPEGKDKALLVQLCKRMNELKVRPEWYHTLSASCTTTIVSQVNQVTPGRIPFTWRALLPGHAARAAFKLKTNHGMCQCPKAMEVVNNEPDIFDLGSIDILGHPFHIMIL